MPSIRADLRFIDHRCVSYKGVSWNLCEKVLFFMLSIDND